MNNFRDDLAIGVDIGATKIASALVARDGRVMASRYIPTNAQQGQETVLNRIGQEIQALAHGGTGLPVGVGIGSPGQVISDQGLVLNPVNLGWERLNLVEELSSRLEDSLPVWIQKDANASALGEYYYGAARGCEDFVYLGVGSGLGCGVMTGGRLVTGSRWNAADIGHLVMDPEGLPCVCGKSGCVETVISGPGLVAAARRILSHPGSASMCEEQAGDETRLAAGIDFSPANVLAAASKRNSVALAALDEVGRALGVVAAACVALLNPALIIVGGGLGMAAFDYLNRPLHIELNRRAPAANLQGLQIVASQLESPAVGAACLVWYGYRRQEENERR